MRRPAVAEVHVDHCNGCTRCVEDCPYGAVSMAPRSDGAKFDLEAVVNPSLCVSCGICVGACPSSTPFRRRGDIVTGIDLPDFSLADLRSATNAAAEGLRGDRRILVFGCTHGPRLPHAGEDSRAFVALPCIGMLPPPFIDYVLSRGLADGVMLSGCASDGCYNRFGIAWTDARTDRERDPQLRRRVPRERIDRFWAGQPEGRRLGDAVEALAGRIPRADAPCSAQRWESKTEEVVSGGQ